MIKNDLFLRVLNGQKVERTPIWMMRQAGRYLPEYRATRAQAGDFLSLCKNPELACEVTLQPLRRYAFDAGIVFSDILTVPDAMDMGLYFETGEGPKFKRQLNTEKDIEALTVPKASDLAYVYETIKLLKKEMTVPLIGFAGSPWTLACYMIEGGSSKDFNGVKALCYGNPDLIHGLLNKLTQATIAYLQEQVRAGADTIMIFDTWGGLLAHDLYAEFSLNYMKTILEALSVPVILFTKNGGQNLSLMAETGARGLGVDWTTSLKVARQVTGDKVVLQGNLDPALMCSNPETVKHAVKKALADYGHGHGHIFNLGHGITPNASPDNVQAMIEALAELSPFYHQE